MPLVGSWVSTEAMGNTALDWSALLKDNKARLHIEFGADGTYSVRLTSMEDEDITSTVRHLPPLTGSYTVEGGDDSGSKGKILIAGDQSDLDWTFENEDDDSLRIRLAGAKRFGRCNVSPKRK